MTSIKTARFQAYWQQENHNKITEKYNWDKIAEQTIDVYQKAMGVSTKGSTARGRMRNLVRSIGSIDSRAQGVRP